jgi:hypothetical protein
LHFQNCSIFAAMAATDEAQDDAYARTRVISALHQAENLLLAELL